MQKGAGNKIEGQGLNNADIPDFGSEFYKCYGFRSSPSKNPRLNYPIGFDNYFLTFFTGFL
jgi:hypothetical protein